MIGIRPFMLPYKPQLIECSSSLYVLFIQRNCRFDHGYWLTIRAFTHLKYDIMYTFTSDYVCSVIENSWVLFFFFPFILSLITLTKIPEQVKCSLLGWVCLVIHIPHLSRAGEALSDWIGLLCYRPFTQCPSWRKVHKLNWAELFGSDNIDLPHPFQDWKKNLCLLGWLLIFHTSSPILENRCFNWWFYFVTFHTIFVFLFD